MRGVLLWHVNLHLPNNVFATRVDNKKMPNATTTKNNLIEIFAFLVLEVSEATGGKEASDTAVFPMLMCVFI